MQRKTKMIHGGVMENLRMKYSGAMITEASKWEVELTQ